MESYVETIVTLDDRPARRGTKALPKGSTLYVIANDTDYIGHKVKVYFIWAYTSFAYAQQLVNKGIKPTGAVDISANWRADPHVAVHTDRCSDD